MANLTPEETLRVIINGSITEISASDLKYIASQKLRDMTTLTALIAPNLEVVNEYGLYNTGVIEADFRKEVTIYSFAFANNKALTRAFLPNADFSQHPQRMFNGCTALEMLVVLGTGTLYTNSFRGCSALSVVDFKGDLGQGDQFRDDVNLKKIILRGSSVNTLNSVGSFLNTPFADGGSGGTIYAYQDLISAYQSATNWSTILSYTNNRILPIEGSQYEHYYADGTPIPE